MAKDSKRGGRKYLANLNNLSKPKPQTSASVVSDAPKYRGPTPAAVAAVAKFGSPSAVGFKPAYTPSAPEPDFTPEQLGTWGPFGFKPAEGSQAVMANLVDRTKPLLAKQIGPILAERLVAAYNKGADKGVERFAYNEMFGNLDPEFFGRNSLSYVNLANPDYEFDTWQKKAQLPIDIAGSVYGGLPLQLGFAYADAKGLSEYAGPGMLGVQTAMTAWNVANNLKQSDFIGAAKAMMPLIKTLGAMGAAHVVYKTTGLNVNGLVDAVQGGALGDIWGTGRPPPPISGYRTFEDRGDFVGEPWMPLLPDLADAGGLLARQRAQETATELAAQQFYAQQAIRQGMPALPAPEPVRTDALALARMADSDVKSRIEEQLVFPRMINQLPQGITHEEAMALVAMQPEMNRLQDDLLSTEIPVVLDQQLKTGVRGGDIFYQLTTLYAEDLKEIEQRRYIDPFESVDGDNRTAGTAENAWEAEAFARYRTFEDRTEGFVENRRGLTGGEAVLYGSLDKSYWEQNLGGEPRNVAYFKLAENARILKITSDEELAQILTERNQEWMQPVEFFRSLKDDFDAIEIRVPANAQSHWWKQVGGDTLVILNDDAIRLVQNPRDILQAVLSRLDAPEPALPAPDAALQLEQQRQRTELRFARGIEEAIERRRRLEDYETLERRRRYDERATRFNPDRDLEGTGPEEWFLDVPGRYEDDLPIVRDQAALVDPATLAALDAENAQRVRDQEYDDVAADAQRVQNQERQYALRVEYHRDYRGSGPNFFQFPDGLSFEQFRANPPELSRVQLDELEWDLASQRSTYEQHADFYDEPLPLDVPDTPERLRAAILDYETNAPNLGRYGAHIAEPETAEQWRSVSNSRATADVERFSAKLLAEQEQSQQRFFLGNVNERGISGLGEAQGASWQDYWNAWTTDANQRHVYTQDYWNAEQIASRDAETRKYAMETFLRPEQAARYDQEKQNWQEQFDAGNKRPQRPYAPEDYGESSVGTLPYPAPQTPVFRSRLVELAEAQSIKKATGEEWLRRLNNKQKVNPGEVLISGIHSVLDPETVYTKEQVLAWLKYTQMTVTATTYQDVHKDIYLRPATYVQQTRLGVTQLPIPDPNRRISPNENYFEIQLNLSTEGALLDELPDHVDELAMAPNRPVPAGDSSWHDMTPEAKTELAEKYGHKPEDLVSVDEYGTPHWMEGHGGFEGRNAIGRIGAEGLSVVYNGKRMKVMWVSEFQGATGDENVANTPPFLRFNNHGFKITMKYLMQYAYKNGYDAIAWTNGKTQEELRSADGLLELYDNMIVGSVNDIIKKTKEKVGQVMRPDSPETGWHHIFEIRTPLMEHLINTEGFTISQAPEDKEKQQRAIA